MDFLSGTELSLPVKFLIAFIIVLALIGATFWLMRRFGGARVGAAATRGRQPRLAVIDAAAVDGRRRLVLIRRDNVEHLVMIGGPTDVVIEQNILRAVPVAPSRDVPVGRPPGVAEAVRSAAEPVPRLTPPQAEEASWGPSVSDLVPRSEPVQRPTYARPEPAPRAPRQTEQRPLPALEPRPMPAAEALPRSTFQPGFSVSRPLPQAEPAPVPSPAAPVAELEPAVEVRNAPPTADLALANMAQRLEAALRRPIASPDGREAEANPRPEAMPATNGDMPRTAPEAPSQRAEAKAGKSKTVLDNLEEEMASLLGRPGGKE